MKFIKGMYPYRMVDDNTTLNKTDGESGAFRVLGKESFEPKAKAQALAECYGGKPDELDKHNNGADPETPDEAAERVVYNYVCTWGRQSYAATVLHISGSGCSEMRDAMNATALFSREDLYHVIPREYRSNLIFLLDDGWDVPIGTDGNGSRAMFGSMEPDAEKFASLGSTALERLKEMSRLTKELGYAGLGLWISPQIPYEGWTSSEDARAYWEERAKWCNEAGIVYWKVDWGRHQADLEYRAMMTECAAKYAPNLIVEHAYPQKPFTMSNTEASFAADREQAVSWLTGHSGCLRIYDLSDPFEAICALNRIHQALTLADANGNSTNCIINAESKAYIGAVLGCSVGIMTFDTEMQACLNWQKLSPVFGTAEAEYRFSDEILTDSYYFDRELSDWFSCGYKTMVETCPAVMARGCDLPTVLTREGSFTPLVGASINPVTGAAAIGTFPRTIDPNKNITGLADITFHVGRTDVPIGVFGIFGSLTLVFDEDLSDGVEIRAKDLLADNYEDISALATVKGNTITIDGTVLRNIGRASRSDQDKSLPSLTLTVTPRS